MRMINPDESEELQRAVLATSISGLVRRMSSDMVRMAELLEGIADNSLRMSLTIDSFDATCSHITGNTGECK